MKTIRKVCVVGNSDFPLDAGVGSQVVDQIRDLGQGVVILTREKPRFDRFVAAVCVALSVRCFTYGAGGGASNIERDSDLIRDCDELHAYMVLDSLDQESGTRWLLDRALAANKPTYAYGVADGILVFVGSQDIETTA